LEFDACGVIGGGNVSNVGIFAIEYTLMWCVQSAVERSELAGLRI